MRHNAVKASNERWDVNLGTIARSRGAGWLRLQLVIFAAATALWVPALGGRSGPGDSGTELLTWFGLPLLLILAGNAAWGLHQAGKASAPLAGLGILAGSALALGIWITPHTAPQADEGVRFLAVLQLAIGGLLIALQWPRLKRIGHSLPSRHASPDSRPDPGDSQRHERTAPLGPLARPSAFRTFPNVVCAFGLAINTLALSLLGLLLIDTAGEWTGDPASDLLLVGLVLTLAVVEVVLLFAFRQWAGPAGRLAPPVLLLLAAAPPLLILGGQPGVSPIAAGLSAVLSLVGAAWYLKARRRMSAPAAGPRPGYGVVQTARPDIHTPSAAVDEPIGSAAKPWSPAELWLSYLIVPILLYGLSIVFAVLLGFAGAGDAVFELGMIEAELLVLWVVLLYLVRRKGHPWSILGLKPFPVRSLLLIPLASFAQASGVGMFNSALLPLLPAVQAYQTSLDPYMEPSAATILLLFLGSVVVAPVVEELLFRGFFFTGFRSYVGPAAASILSALLFSLAHAFPILAPFSINLDPSQALGAFLGGLTFAGLRHDSDSIFPPILAHAFWNLGVIL